jgi:hypothetical protein
MNGAHAYEMQVQSCEPNTWCVTVIKFKQVTRMSLDGLYACISDGKVVSSRNEHAGPLP